MSLRTALRPTPSRARRIVTAGIVTASAAVLGVTGVSGTASAASAAESNQDIAREMIDDDTQYACFANIVDHESDWDHTATNASSGAYGLVQALPASKMAEAGADWKTNPETQIEWGLDYMNERYGSPCGAWAFWQANQWY
ncbi:aggregation-promoting factor C-terminal-like domain-containing protein [Streptomyces specialis]|uniref:aggregation-promoting factor C-terminal-like domain-containing protein n=1 Tax=Streptomyces specialis TaxID=498367 RepID=UPI00073E65DA|nr:transglycosylase SLT domain-containing protein [Streptomyces specialis]